MIDTKRATAIHPDEAIEDNGPSPTASVYRFCFGCIQGRLLAMVAGYVEEACGLVVLATVWKL